MIWNVRDEKVPWIREMTELMVPYEGTAPRFRSMKWREAFDRTSLLTPLELTKFHHETKGPIEMMIDRVASVSFVASLDEKNRHRLLEQMRALYQRVLVSGETLITMPYETQIYIARRA